METVGSASDFDVQLEISRAALSMLDNKTIYEYTRNYSIDTGWPDLVLLKNENIELVEVKTTDKLHSNQILQIQNIKRYLPYSINVVRVIRI